jgi:hypothetical protein
MSKYNWSDQVKKDEMGGACRTNGGKARRKETTGKIKT